MAIDAAPLFVTLITGADARLRARLMRTLGADRWVAGGRAHDSDDPMGTVSENLADVVIAAAQGGARGHLALSLDATVDPLEACLVMQQRFLAQHPSQAPVHLRDVVTVVHPDELQPLVDHQRLSPIAELEALADRVECATIVVIAQAGARRAADVAHALNPRAAIVAVDDVAAVTRIRLRELVRPPVGDLAIAQGWMLALNAPSLSAIDDPCSRFVFRDPRPFHPVRLAEVVASYLVPEVVGTIWRSRGLVRLASRVSRVGSWSTVGATLSLDPTSMTSVDVDAPSGQEIAFVGDHLDAERLADCLGSALLSDDELIAGPMEWQTYADPFPVWNLDHTH